MQGQTINVLFRVDASPEIGGGHVMRCLALAEHLVDIGWRTSFACRASTFQAVPELQKSSHRLIMLDIDEKDEAAFLVENIEDKIDWLIVDHYGRDRSFEAACRVCVSNILVIDDLADRPHDCDILLDQTLGRSVEDYEARVPASCLILTGTSYALLRRQFSSARTSEELERRGVLASFGLMDPWNLISRTLDGFDKIDVDVSVSAVLGTTAPHLDSVKNKINRDVHRHTLHVSPNKIAHLMATSEVLVGAAGSTVWEACCMGLPTVLIVTAENQRGVAAAVADAGAAQVLGDEEGVNAEEIARSLNSLLSDRGVLQKMAAKAATLCDGRGAARVAMAMSPERDRNGRPILLRQATMGDAEALFFWQTSGGLRRYFRNPANPEWNQHVGWLKNQLTRRDSLLNIILCDDVAVGMLRLDRISCTSSAFEVSILVGRDHHRSGIARAALALSRRLVPDARLLAEVQSDNEASHKLFKNAGFSKSGDHYELAPLISEGTIDTDPQAQLS